MQGRSDVAGEDTDGSPGAVERGLVPVDRSPVLSPFHLLAVEEQGQITDLAVTTLGRVGITSVRSAHNAAEALDVLRERRLRIDLILYDLNMAGMDGMEFLRVLAQESYQGAVALMSDESPSLLRSVAELARAHGLAFVGTVAKPIVPDELRSVIRRARNEAMAVDPSLPDVVADDVAGALDQGHLTVRYQPKVATDTKRVIGAEALARWQHPQWGAIPPDTFIPVAEESVLIDRLTDQVLGTVLADLAVLELPDSVASEFRLAVNLSTKVLHTPQLPEQWSARVDDAGLRPSMIVFEVTESHLADDYALALEVLSRLRLKGFGLSIDDFGTGYASMQQLRTTPFSELKVDRSFVHGSADDDSMRAILETSTELGRRLGLEVVAEGVESRADWDVVAEVGCDAVQGWFVAPSLSPDELTAWVEQWTGDLG